MIFLPQRAQKTQTYAEINVCVNQRDQQGYLYSPAENAEDADLRRDKPNLVRVNQRNQRDIYINKKGRIMLHENDISYLIRGAVFQVYDELGPGLLESIYEAALCYQLRKDGLKVANQVKVDVYYDGHLLPIEYRLDLLVEDKVIVELKSVETVNPVHFKQLLTYLKITGKKLGMLVNFNTDDINHSIYRKVNGL